MAIRKGINMETVTGLFKQFEEADRVIRALEESGFDRQMISVIARDSALADRLGLEPTVGEVASSAGVGAATGGLGGGLIGLLAGLGALLIPGIGPVFAAGSIATALGLAAGGAGVGAAVGGILGAMTGLSIAEEDADVYAEGVRRGEILVAVETPEERVDEVHGIMDAANAEDIQALRETWKREGWTPSGESGVD
jgi:hypothetical protein